jgi:hypothetical protein
VDAIVAVMKAAGLKVGPTEKGYASAVCKVVAAGEGIEKMIEAMGSGGGGGGGGGGGDAAAEPEKEEEPEEEVEVDMGGFGGDDY